MAAHSPMNDLSAVGKSAALEIDSHPPGRGDPTKQGWLAMQRDRMFRSMS